MIASLCIAAQSGTVELTSPSEDLGQLSPAFSAHPLSTNLGLSTVSGARPPFARRRYGATPAEPAEQAPPQTRFHEHGAVSPASWPVLDAPAPGRERQSQPTRFHAPLLLEPLERGTPADLVLLDDDGHVVRVMRRGKWLSRG